MMIVLGVALAVLAITAVYLRRWSCTPAEFGGGEGHKPPRDDAPLLSLDPLLMENPALAGTPLGPLERQHASNRLRARFVAAEGAKRPRSESFALENRCIVMRHAERADHASRSWRTQHPHHLSEDPPLSAAGRRQALESALYLYRQTACKSAEAAAAWTCNVLAVSPYLRCVETAIPLWLLVGGMRLEVSSQWAEHASARVFKAPPAVAAVFAEGASGGALYRWPLPLLSKTLDLFLAELPALCTQPWSRSALPQWLARMRSLASLWASHGSAFLPAAAPRTTAVDSPPTVWPVYPESRQALHTRVGTALQHLLGSQRPVASPVVSATPPSPVCALVVTHADLAATAVQSLMPNAHHPSIAAGRSVPYASWTVLRQACALPTPPHGPENYDQRSWREVSGGDWTLRDGHNAGCNRAMSAIADIGSVHHLSTVILVQ